MKNRFENVRWTISPAEKTVFINANDIYPDGTLPAWRDGSGTLWALSGHTHMGHIGVFAGPSLAEMKEQYRLQTNFVCGRAGHAFDGVKYPEGVLPRGSIWPFGLWIHEPSGRFYAFFHNETGWNAGKTGYTAFGEFPGEPDFRHIGLMHSDDQGRTWDFDRWVITSYEACYTETYRPDGLTDGGQKPGVICLGAGDFTIFVNPNGKDITLYYTMLQYDMDKKDIIAIDVYAARSEIREDGRIGDFVKYYQGRFDQPGNMGREEKIITDAWHPHVVYSEPLKCYVLSARATECEPLHQNRLVVYTSDDLVHWSEPLYAPANDDCFNMHYFSIINPGSQGPHNVIGSDFAVLSCNNGTDLLRFNVHIDA